MKVEQIKVAPPEDAVFWSPAVEQYFDRQYMNLAFRERGKLIQVEPQFRGELVRLIEQRGKI